jgi:hypothetical protein
MATKFFLYDNDPLDLIVKHKRLIQALRANGIDGFEINKIMRNMHGLHSEMPIKLTPQQKAARRQAGYGMRWTNNLIKNPLIEDEEKEFLVKLYNRLYHVQKLWDISKSGKPVIKWKYDEDKCKAKSLKQMNGLRVVDLYNYILPFMHTGKKEKVFHLIAELFDVMQNEKLTFQQIKTFYHNNK